ncbi:MAG TPA: L-threonylcarbamoyladenylate synthase [Microbacteriaceae bacterium]|nr:L-threonylcarbamoyladenylate synthase [Microbacteriaceae bacterium]
MVEIFDITDSAALLSGSRKARLAISQGSLIVLPTDTVYGVAADAFKADAVAALLEAKGRGRQSPPPVLVADINAIAALAAYVPESIYRLAEQFWPGPLTIVLAAQPSLDWDLGDTGGTVALRIPDHEVTLEILRETGPLAVSSANITGEPAARNAAEAQEMLGEAVEVIIDAGESAGGIASTIIDATKVTDDGGVLRILRQGPITIEDLAEVCPELTIALTPKKDEKRD